MTRQTSRAKDHYSLALQQYKKGEYLETVKSVDKAISFGYRDVVVYDVKAAALSKLTNDDEVVWRDQAMDVIQYMCKQWGTKDWRPWHRKAEYLRSRGLYVHAITAIDKALELVESKNRNFLTSKQAAIRGEREAARAERDRKMATATEAEKKAIMEARRAEARSTQDSTQLLPPDVLLLIADNLLLDNPSIGCRLSGVCRRWRDVYHGQPGLWTTLVLGKHRPRQKAITFMERNKGSLLKLKLLAGFDPAKVDLGTLLCEHVDQLKSLELANQPYRLFEQLQGRCHSLEQLTQKENDVLQYGTPKHQITRADRGLMLNETNPTLRSLRLETTRVDLSEGHGVLSGLRTLDLHDCVIDSPLIEKGSLECLHHAAPLLERLTMVECNFYLKRPEFTPSESSIASDDKGPAMTSLTEFTGESTMPGLFFGTIAAPNLVRLELSRYASFKIIEELRTPGLADALPNLQVLDIANHILRPDDLGQMVELLSGMSSLRFLNVSFTFVENSDDFLRALTWNNTGSEDVEGIQADILPNLEGLSIAGLEITSIPLRDLVLSRLPPIRQSTASTKTPSSSSRSAFKPSSSRAEGSPVPSVSASQRRPAPTSSASIQDRQSQASSTQNTRKACLKWLCVDHCTSIDSQLPVYLATKLPFVSHSLRDKKVNERIKGKGRYSWEMEYYHSCADEATEKCTVERVEGTTDQWRLVHRCGKQDTPYEPEPNVDNIWESQWDPSSTQSDQSPIPTGTKSGEARGWAKVGSTASPATNSGGSSSSGIKRVAGDMGGSTASTSQRLAPSKARKGKGRMQISVGADGSLTGF